MTGEALPRIEITEMYGRLNEGLIDLVEYIPDDKLEWSPQDGLWDFHHILAHLVFARHNWMGNSISQKIKPEQIHGLMATKIGMQEQLRRSWEAVKRFLSDEANLDRVYKGETDGQPYSFRGHFIAYHLLEHDIHHRADVFHYLALLGVEHPDVETP